MPVTGADLTWSTVFLDIGQACEALAGDYRLYLLNHDPFVELVPTEAMRQFRGNPNHYEGMLELMESLLPPSAELKTVMRAFCQQHEPLRAILSWSPRLSKWR